MAKPESLSLIAEMSEKIVFIRQSADAQQYFADSFKKLFNLEHCAIYRVSEKRDLFIRSFQESPKKKNNNIFKYPIKCSLTENILKNFNQYLFLKGNEISLISEVNEKTNPEEILLTVRRSGEVELFFYGLTSTSVEVSDEQNDVCRIISNFYLQVQDSLQIRF